ncbi:MAG: 1-deoxy-D-xylulose-5-phosphate synthase [Deltaproteobacteria bacterium]|nr:1-deoxy-D-xylulose-5-phosphate synthase [Deltaproteobacteria bacterium]
MNSFSLIPKAEFERIRKSDIPQHIKLELIADMCRANTLTSVKIAGSGHIGSSFSAMDIVVYLYYKEMNTIELGFNNPDRDIYFSSKGHDVPGLYSVLFSLGILPKEKFIKLRRIDGLDGHPDVSIDGIECNSGSLGMGISKAKGMAIAKKLSRSGGRLFVLTGDGELQEGQIYEALQSAAHHKINNLTVIIDHNKVQSDKRVDEICDLGKLEQKLRSFNWNVSRCSGHDFMQITDVMREFSKIKDQPKILIADTIKGRGVSFMEHPAALKENEGIYQWHSGAPDDRSFLSGLNEIVERISEKLSRIGMPLLKFEPVVLSPKPKSGVSSEYVSEAYGNTLIDISRDRKDIVVLDADLATDCKIRKFEQTYPDRFIENGIAEQDMVSMAGGLALQGYLPVVNSFGAFLASRANEQIYTNACEGTKIIYVCHYAGLIPAGPGKSHQSIRDISLFSALPNFEIIQPCNEIETHMALDYCVNETSNNCVLRLVIGPSPRVIHLPEGYTLSCGKGVIVREGIDNVIFGYGPVMLNEAIVAAALLERQGHSLKIVNMPWLNRIDSKWLISVLEDCENIFILEDHSSNGGLGDKVLRTMANENIFKDKRFKIIGIDNFPSWGTPSEVLGYHKVDGAAIAESVMIGSGII